MIKLEITKRTDKRLLERMESHYSRPKGFVGRSICYAILYNDIYYGHIIGGSATLFLPNRNQFFNINNKDLNKIINNIFYNISKVGDKYPIRNFTSKILKEFRKQISIDWKNKYGDDVIGFETLVEKPRKGELYLRDNWQIIGETTGFTCKRAAGKGTDSWSGKRIWNTNKDQLRPKLVLVRKNS